MKSMLCGILVLCYCHSVYSFGIATVKSKQSTNVRSSSQPLFSISEDQSAAETDLKQDSTVQKYRNAATSFLSNFVSKDETESSLAGDVLLEAIDFEAPKIPASTSLDSLVAALDYELIEKEWFVTGNVNPSYYSEDFEFQDPDVQVKGIADYAQGVRKIFDQKTSRAQILSTVINTTVSTPERPVITVTWRLSGKVNIGVGLNIKPYIVYTDFVVDPATSLIIFQEDRFDIPAWDIFLSALFPFLIGRVTAPPAPEVETRIVAMPNLGTARGPSAGGSPLDAVLRLFGQ